MAWFIKPYLQSLVRQTLGRRRHRRRVVTDLRLASKAAGGRINQPIRPIGGQLSAGKFLPRPDHDAVRFRIDSHDEPAVTHRHTHPLALADGKALDAGMRANHFACGGDDLPRHIDLFRDKPRANSSCLAAGDEANLLAVLLLPQRACRGAIRRSREYAAFEIIANRQQHLRGKSSLGDAKQHVRLILAVRSTPLQSTRIRLARALLQQTGVMAGGDVAFQKTEAVGHSQTSDRTSASCCTSRTGWACGRSCIHRQNNR